MFILLNGGDLAKHKANQVRWHSEAVRFRESGLEVTGEVSGGGGRKSDRQTSQSTPTVAGRPFITYGTNTTVFHYTYFHWSADDIVDTSFMQSQQNKNNLARYLTARSIQRIEEPRRGTWRHSDDASVETRDVSKHGHVFCLFTSWTSSEVTQHNRTHLPLSFTTGNPYFSYAHQAHPC